MNTQQIKQQRQLATFAIGGTFLIWFVAMVLSYESQVEFAISIGMTSTIFGISKAYAFPVLTDTVIFVSAAWSLLATLQGLPNMKYRIANLFFGGVTIWFNTHSIDLSQANYTAIFAVAWIPAMVIISTEMLLGYFQQQAEMQREFVSKSEDKDARMIVALEAIANNQRTLTVAPDITGISTPNYTHERTETAPDKTGLEKANEARMAKKEANLAEALELFNEGKTAEIVADRLGVALLTAKNYRKELNGRVKNDN